MNTTKERLRKLETILIEKRAPVLQHFNPGLSQAEVLLFFQSHNIRIHSSLLPLYEWHNGVTSVYGHMDGITNLLPFGSLFNLNEMLLLRNVFREWVEDGDFGDFGDLDNYLPFLGSGESDMFLLNLTTGEILGFQPMIQIFRELRFRSIDAMIDCIIECLETGALTIDEKSGLDAKFELYTEIQKKHL